jgi:hypothetical protein
MESNDFYRALASLPKSYRFSITDNVITTTQSGQTLNPVTAVAYRKTGEIYGTNKRDTIRAGRALGLDKDFVNHVYNATTSVSNRGNTQVVRGKIRSALGV